MSALSTNSGGGPEEQTGVTHVPVRQALDAAASEAERRVDSAGREAKVLVPLLVSDAPVTQEDAAREGGELARWDTDARKGFDCAAWRALFQLSKAQVNIHTDTGALYLTLPALVLALATKKYSTNAMVARGFDTNVLYVSLGRKTGTPHLIGLRSDIGSDVAFLMKSLVQHGCWISDMFWSTENTINASPVLNPHGFECTSDAFYHTVVDLATALTRPHCAGAPDLRLNGTSGQPAAYLATFDNEMRLLLEGRQGDPDIARHSGYGLQLLDAMLPHHIVTLSVDSQNGEGHRLAPTETLVLWKPFHHKEVLLVSCIHQGSASPLAFATQDLYELPVLDWITLRTNLQCAESDDRDSSIWVHSCASLARILAYRAVAASLCLLTQALPESESFTLRMNVLPKERMNTHPNHRARIFQTELTLSTDDITSRPELQAVVRDMPFEPNADARSAVRTSE